MTLATVLALGNYPYTLIKMTERKAIWEFDPPVEREEEFEDLLDEYDQFLHKVEARSFTLRLSEIRRELYDLLRVGHRPVAPAQAQ